MGGFGGFWCAINLCAQGLSAIFIPIVGCRPVRGGEGCVGGGAPSCGKYHTVPPFASIAYDLDFASGYDFGRDVLEAVDDAVDFPLEQQHLEFLCP